MKKVKLTLVIMTLFLLTLCACSGGTKDSASGVTQGSRVQAEALPENGAMVRAILAGADDHDVSLLLSKGANPNEKVKSPNNPTEFITPIFVAVMKNNYRVAKILLYAGADAHATYLGYFPFEMAKQLGYRELAELLVKE